MNCQVCRKFLPLFIDFPLPFKKRSQIERHLKTCEACRKELKALSHTINLIQRVPAPPMPEDFLPRLRARLKSERSQHREWRLWNPWAWGTISAAALILLTLMLYPPLNNNKLTPGRRISQTSPAAAAKVKSPAAIPTAWAEPERNIPHIFDQDDPLPIPALMSRKRRLYQSIGYSIDSSDEIHSSVESTPTRETDPSYGQKGEWTGERCSITSPRNLILHNSEDLKALWLEAGINSISMPELDWTKHMLGAIFLGKQPGREYEIHLNEIQEFRDKVVVKYRVIAPPKKASGETTCPFLLFTLQVSPLPVEFLIKN